MHIALFEPEIPPNTDNIIRLCANSNSQLHLIHPLGFSLDEKQLRRAGLDYRDLTHVHEYRNYADFLAKFSQHQIYACSTKGKNAYTQVQFLPEAVLLFGPETRGLPSEILQNLPAEQVIRIPMQVGSRSINLSNAVAIILYEALRQHHFINLR